MRRSKSNPSKYAKNYRKISQRRMTQYDGLDEDKEMKRLRDILRSSQARLGQEEQETRKYPTLDRKQRKRGRSTPMDPMTADSEVSSSIAVLSEDLQKEAYGENEENPLVVVKKKKQKKTNKMIMLTPEEIKQAKALHKKTEKKLKQLEARASQKKERAELYKKLEAQQLSQQTATLLSSSGQLSRKGIETKKQALSRLVKKERAGIKLTSEEHNLLYHDRKEEGSLDTIGSTSTHIRVVTTDSKPQTPRGTEKAPTENQSTNESNKNVQQEAKFDLVAQMMTSLSSLKQDVSSATPVEAIQKEGVDGEQSFNATKKYVPMEEAVLKTAAGLGLTVSKIENKQKIIQIKRPSDVEKQRYDLPVSSMEYEIVESVRENDVTIICGETGSGKSTQVPQVLYENGLSLGSAQSKGSFMIGITQPRRVAAVSTAVRVCYEMGCGNGQKIKGKQKKGNLVSYRTRYETAGVGSNSALQFMTDGVLLQEIQRDLLLRKYSVVILDEAHERNLNTDVLIGLLSISLPLRRQAAAEDQDLVPLRLVLMSATLKVRDFTENSKLFPTITPSVIRVPGRTHPVTIHHSKSTELEDYESVAFKKIMKIHRNLPKGGILVFLTGKAEIIRMVNRLRRAIPSGKLDDVQATSRDVVSSRVKNNEEFPRDADDDDFDALDVLGDDDHDKEEEGGVNEVRQANEDHLEDDDRPTQATVLPLYSLLCAKDQARVFAPVPDERRLIVIATNVAETSITIPGISYVVDTGRQKCKNYSSGTGVASFDVTWISKAAADQRAGRAGRTGPGHCFRLFSSSLYSRHMDPFPLPEVLTRPLEDVILTMKAFNVSNIANFPFPTPPDFVQIDSAIRLLSNLGCIDVSGVEREDNDGKVTTLGRAVAQFPLGVRYGKMLLVAAQAGVLDYAIAVVSVLSEKSPFSQHGIQEEKETSEASDMDDDSPQLTKKTITRRDGAGWHHKNGDLLSAMLAVGAYEYTTRNNDDSEQKQFCETNGLDHVIVCRIQKMRMYLMKLMENRLPAALGARGRSGGAGRKMSPPTKVQERLLVQAITSGLLDNIALLVPPGAFSEQAVRHSSAYLICSSKERVPIFLDSKSTLFSRDYKQLPKWVCYDTLLLKTAKDGRPIRVMKNVTAIDPSWLGELAKSTSLVALGPPMSSPPPSYDSEKESIVCTRRTKYGVHGWEISPVKSIMSDSVGPGHGSLFSMDDTFRWFARFLLEGKVFPNLDGFATLLNDKPSVITGKTPSTKVDTMVSELSTAGVNSGPTLRKHWADVDKMFLFKFVKRWIISSNMIQAKRMWFDMVDGQIDLQRNDAGAL